MALLYLEKLRKDINILYGYVKCLMAKEDQTSPLVATAWSPNHTIALGNPYEVGNYVYWQGHVYACKANNEGIPPTNTAYWTDLGEGHLLQEEPSTGSQNETDPIFQSWLATNPLAGFLTEENDPIFNAWLATNPLSSFLTTEADPVFTAWLATNPLSPYFFTPAGSTSEYVRGDGSLATFPTFNSTSTVKHTVKNDGTSLITKGTPVYSTGADGTNILVGKAGNGSEATSSKTMGLMETDITTTGGTQTGSVITEGLLGGLNTAGTTAGDPVWLGPTGTLIYGLINKPYAPAHLVFIGIVTKVSAGSGEIFVKVQNGFELKEIHDVDLITTPPSNNQVLAYDTATSLWKNKSIGAILGYTPYRYLDSTQVLYAGSTLGSAIVIGLTETIVSQTTILGGTFNASDLMKIFYKCVKPVGVSTVNMRIRINTTNTLVGATQISILGLLSNNTYGLENRNINLSGGLGFSYNVASSVPGDINNTNTTGTPFTLDTTNDLYVFFTIQFGNLTDSATFQLASITN